MVFDKNKFQLHEALGIGNVGGRESIFELLNNKQFVIFVAAFFLSVLLLLL